MTDEFNTLAAATKAVVESVIAECRIAGKMVSRPHGENGAVYAYPKGHGEIHWGVNGGPHGFNIARGTRR